MSFDLLDPTKFTAVQLKQLGMWPPPNNAGVAIAPYVRRMNRLVDVLVIGAEKGESIVYLCDNCPNINLIYGLSHTNEHDELLVANIGDNSKVKRDYDGQKADIVIINVLPETTTEQLAQYYEKVKDGGYIVGDHHNEGYVKDALHKFRRSAKIGHPINIVEKVIWFWKK